MATNPNSTPYRPLYFYVVYELPEGIYGYKVDWKPAWEAERDYDTVFKFEGREAAYWIATNDRSIIRTDALSFAIGVHNGKKRIINCDLSQVSK